MTKRNTDMVEISKRAETNDGEMGTELRNIMTYLIKKTNTRTSATMCETWK